MIRKKPIVPHKRGDCVSLRTNGAHHSYASYLHAEMVSGFICNGDETTVHVDRWGVHDERQTFRDFGGQMICCVR